MKKEIKKLSQELDLPEDTIKEIYNLFWFFIKQKIISFPKNINSEEDLNNWKPNLYIPKIGKLGVTYKKFLNKIKKDAEYKENKTNG